ncbi:uncharacterized protein EAF02_000077 [Botrytis sinoallii]|uniref:uncharacterized protein n=1 Tax=Botrytis sinoallii TaxID=1463999 RepID=UPI001900597C|nr:uncharacterized protein EAF02_000077 [Botrytis sinoallii]KAF7892539.1 hypothetical protein EAF02_000077 [Botrytis sinoallii]
MHILPLLYIFLPFLVFTPATTLSTTESEIPLQTTKPTQPTQRIQTIAQSTNPASSPPSQTQTQTPLQSTSTPLSSGTYLPPTRLTSQTKSTLAPNSTASLILTPTTSSSNAFESDWDKVTNWLSGSGASSLDPASPYWGAWVVIGVGVAWGGW